jgi:hypothetical protein
VARSPRLRRATPLDCEALSATELIYGPHGESNVSMHQNEV